MNGRAMPSICRPIPASQISIIPVEVPHASVRFLGENATDIGHVADPPGVPSRCPDFVFQTASPE